MKSNYSEIQFIQIAKERIYELFMRLPVVSRIEITRIYSQTANSDFDVLIYLRKRLAPISFAVSVRSRGERRFAVSFATTVMGNKDSINYIFVAPYISNETADYLQNNGINYMDLCGNCYIIADQIFVAVEGKQNIFNENNYSRNYFSRSASTASMILRTMLFCNPNTVWYVNALAGAANASLGATSNLRRFLIENDCAEDLGSGFKIKNRSELLRLWSKEYGKGTNRTYQFYSIDNISDIERRISDWNHTHETTAVLGFFAAAARYAPTVRYNKVHVYLKQEELSNFVESFELKEVSSGGNINIIIPHDDTVCHYLRTINGDLLTTPEQTVLDLMNVPGRGQEAAEAIIQKEFM